MSFEAPGGDCCIIQLCDANAVPFLRKFIRQCTAGQEIEIIFEDYELDGSTPFVPTEPITVCDISFNQFEGLSLSPYCDVDTGVIVGYFAITRTEDEPQVFETLYFDTNGNQIGGQPANSVICEPDKTFDWSVCYKDENGIQFNRVFHKNEFTDAVEFQDHLDDGSEYTPVGVLSPCDGSCYIPFGDICYYIPGGVVEITSSQWVVDSPTLAHMTVPIPDTATSITFTIERLSGDGQAESPVQCQPPTPDTNMSVIQTVNSQWKITWDKTITGPFNLGIYDIDSPGELVTQVAGPPADHIVNIPTTGSGQWSYFQWDDAAVFANNSITLEFTPSCYGFAINGVFTIPDATGKAFVFYDCDGARKLIDTNTNVELDEAEVDTVDCLEVNSYSEELVCATVGVDTYTAIRKVRVVNGNEFVTYLGTNGAEIEPDTWEPGPCSVAGVTETLVCVTVGDETYTAIKREVNGVITFLSVDGVEIVPDTWSPGPCEIFIATAYIDECKRYDNNLPINYAGQFDNTPATTSDILFESSNVVALIRNEAIKAVSLNDHLQQRGLPRVTMVLSTVDNLDVSHTYEFYPEGVDVNTISSIVIDDAEVVAWGGNGQRVIESMQYSTLDSCECKPVETLQYINDNIMTLAEVYDLASYDPTTRAKPSLLDGNGLLELYTLGPYPGPCPEDPQVVEYNTLCCDDDLAINQPAVAATRIAWLDAADNLDNLLDAIGGVPIAGNDGNIVGQVLDKLGGANTFDEGGGPNGGPYYKLNRLNSLPGLQFLGNPVTGNNIADHLEIGLGAGILIGSPFQVFYLLKPANPNAPENACYLACGPSYGTQFAGIQGTWQISRGEAAQGTQNNLVFRYNQLGGFGSNVDIPLMPWTDFADGLGKLITLFYDGTDVNVYINGDNLLSFSPTTALLSQFFRIFGNRQDESYPSGDLYEMFISDGTLDTNQIATINAYLICKWGIDPSQAVGGAGDLVLATEGAYTAPTPFVRVVTSDGKVSYINTLNNQSFPLPPVPGLSICRDGCNFCDENVLTVVDDVVTGNYTIPEGALAYSIAIESGTATINGAIRPTGYVISQSPMSFGNVKWKYPAIPITAVTGTVHVNYVME